MAAVYEQAQSVTNPTCIVGRNGNVGPSVRFYTGRRAGSRREERHRLARTPLKGLDKHGGEGCVSKNPSPGFSEDAYKEPEPIRLQWQEDDGRRRTDGRIISDPPESDSVYTEPEAVLIHLHVSLGRGQASAAAPGAGEEEQTPEGNQQRHGQTQGSRSSSDPDMGQTLEHRIGYMEKLSRQLLQTLRHSQHFPWSSTNYWGTADNNVLRVAEKCDKAYRRVGKPRHSVEETYTEALLTAIVNSDMLLELEILKSLGDLYLERGKADVSRFSKAAAMYNKALTRCRDPETKVTLEHRIRYLKKIREAVEKKPTSKKARRKERRAHMEHQSGNITRTDVIKDQHQHPDITRLYKDHLTKGDSSLARADLDSAEQHFSAALKMVHVRDATAQQYQREVEPLCKLGDVYSKRGQQTGDGGDFVKAAALYNAAIARSEDQVINVGIATAIREVEVSFLNRILKIPSRYNVTSDNTENHKKQLKEMRGQIKLDMETVDQQLDPYVHDEDDPCVREIEAKRAQAVRHLFENIAEQRKEFISLLVEECIGLMGLPPCKYALIGLGSQATGLVTPYSDLEFAILVEEESVQCLEYFLNFTRYLHLKVVNLGETILPALRIKCLNDWYYDTVTPRGFAFDGSMPKACKTPLGRQGTMNEPPSHLICTPSNMASKLQKDATLYHKEGYHLATILRNPCLIAGDQDLIDTYMAITGKILQADGGKMAQQLAQETLREHIESFRHKGPNIAWLTDVKKDIYRLPAVEVDCLALSTHIVPTTVWKTIEELENQQVISSHNAHHLTVLTSISAELRLRTYIANGGQRENFSALASTETGLHETFTQDNNDVQRRVLTPIFHLPNDRQLFRYYYTAVPLEKFLQGWSEKKQDLTSIADLYDNSAKVRGLMYFELCKHEQALSCFHEALKKTDGTDLMDKSSLLSFIGFSYMELGDYRNAISFTEQSLELRRGIHGQNSSHPHIARLLIILGGAWNKLCDYRKAINFSEQALQIFRSIHGQSTANRDIAASLDWLGTVFSDMGNHRKAIRYHEQAQQMYRSIHGENKIHPNNSLNNLGTAWSKVGDQRKAIHCHENALQTYVRIYGQSTAHPDIASSLVGLGEAWLALGEQKKAISFLEQSLQMYRSIYGSSKEHPQIALTLSSLGSAWGDLGDYRKALGYYEQAHQMIKSVCGQNVAHYLMAMSLNSLGFAWSRLGDGRKAIYYIEQALQMNTCIYGPNTAHPLTAHIFTNLGLASRKVGDCRKAISYLEQGLRMYRSIHGRTTAHLDIVCSLLQLGLAWHDLKDYKKAMSYHEQSLQMRRSIHGQTTANIDVAKSLFSLMAISLDLGNHQLQLSPSTEGPTMPYIPHSTMPYIPHPTEGPTMPYIPHPTMPYIPHTTEGPTMPYIPHSTEGPTMSHIPHSTKNGSVGIPVKEAMLGSAIGMCPQKPNIAGFETFLSAMLILSIVQHYIICWQDVVGCMAGLPTIHT
uniref:Uncharacterized protein n=1 Tax=Branchiostoma floridae TaxID=7739 RepID=C3YTE3_BRAFL|eukprot:XP_002600498.1 hypothetical protein BRAFLDRAFT_70133 [Branchiostoma floridae]